MFIKPCESLARTQKFGLTILACAATTLIATPLLGALDLANIVMLFLLTVLLIAVSLGLDAALLSAFLSVALFDFFFVPPRFSFSVSDGQYLITFVVMLAVAIITGKLTANLRQRANESTAEAARSQALYEMARDLTGALTTTQISEITQSFLRRGLQAEAIILLDGLRPCGEESPKHIRIEPHLATLAHERGETLECTQLVDSGYAAIYLPLKAPMRARGVVAVAPLDGDALRVHAQRQWLETMASLVAIAIERVHYVDVAQRTQVQIVSERLRSSILSALSHDLRTPLTALVGLADSLVASRPPLNEAARETASALRDQSEHLANLVGNLLDMARLHAGQVTLHKEWQPIDEVIGSSIKLLGRTLTNHPINVQLSPGLPLVEFDAVLIERVFCNLLENAAKYTPPGRGIRIEAGLRDRWLDVGVIDEGQGFSGDTGNAIFDMFVRGERETTRPGVGLGLAICRAIVEAHGGTITASNNPNGGACLRFTLPLGIPPTIEEEETGFFDEGASQ